VQQDRRAGALAQGGRDPYVIVVGVGADDGPDGPVADHGHDRVDVVRRVDHHALGVVADHPDVVVDVVRLTVEAERARDNTVVDAYGRILWHGAELNRATFLLPRPS
jgi:hypothetical protein